MILAKQTGINLIHVPYRGVAPAVTDMVAGRVDLMFSSYVTAGPHIESGKLRMLAIAGAKRHPKFPELPTMAEAGFPGVEMEQWFGLFGPAGMPEPIVRKLNEAFVEALESDEVRNTLLPQGSVIIPGHAEGSRGHGRARHRAARAGGEGLRRQAGVSGATAIV